MIYELRTYTLKHGSTANVAKAAGEVGRAVRGDNFGKLEGYWVTEIGHSTRSCIYGAIPISTSGRASEASWRAMRAGRASTCRSFSPISSARRSASSIRSSGRSSPRREGNIYEFRYYRVKPGGIKKWVELFMAALPVREKYSKIVGLWTTEAGQPNEVCHIWAYPDLNARQEARAGPGKDPAWQEFIEDRPSAARGAEFRHHAPGSALAAEIELPTPGEEIDGERCASLAVLVR